MKKYIYVLILPLLVAGGLVFANHATNKKQSQPPTPTTECMTERAKWEASPDGIKYKEWEASEAGQKVMSSTAKIKKAVREFTGMEAVITSLTLPPGSRLGYGIMVKIDGEDYILSFGAGKSDQFKQLRNLKVNDRIVIKSSAVLHAPKYAYPIISGEKVEKDGQLIYERPLPEDGC